MVSPPI